MGRVPSLGAVSRDGSPRHRSLCPKVRGLSREFRDRRRLVGDPVRGSQCRLTVRRFLVLGRYRHLVPGRGWSCRLRFARPSRPCLPPSLGRWCHQRWSSPRFQQRGHGRLTPINSTTPAGWCRHRLFEGPQLDPAVPQEERAGPRKTATGSPFRRSASTRSRSTGSTPFRPFASVSTPPDPFVSASARSTRPAAMSWS